MKNNAQKSILILAILIIHLGYSQESLMNKFDLMPWPASIEDSNGFVTIDSDFSISINQKEGRVFDYATNFLRRLSNRTGVFIATGFPHISETDATVQVNFKTTESLSISTDESYKLSFNSGKIYIDAISDVGALRGLETLLQLVKFNKSEFYFDSVLIEDSPRFVWRGLMIDVSRHFHPVDVLKRNLRAMAAMKMNVFHWHLTDDQGYRIESKVLPKLHEQASDGLYYTHEQIKEVVSYANTLGIRVVPEIDVPGHASSILSAYPELGSGTENYPYAIERNSGIFDPTLDPTNEETYIFLEKLFTEVSSLFPDEYFHIGGDENEGKHWDANPAIVEFKEEHKLNNNHELQTYFNIKLEKILNEHGKKLMGWDEILTSSTPKTAVIHSWRGVNEGFQKGGALIEAAKTGYQTVLSAGFYIDRMQSVDGHYSVDPIGDVSLTEEETKRILGGEATMWSELVTPLTIDSRIWPRTAAIAERFWSPKEVNNVDLMRKRLKPINHQLEELGVTHIRNKEVILRNITQNQNPYSLLVLSEICEPLKVYSRNEGGTEYKTFSPFTLFADATNVDADDAYDFNTTVNKYHDSKSQSDTEHIQHYLDKWINAYQEFTQLNESPILSTYATHYKALDEISRLLLSGFENPLSKKEIKQIEENLDVLKTPMADTEFRVVDSIESLAQSLKK